jgi:hypothetical protein
MELDDLSVQLRAQSAQIEEAIKRIGVLSEQAAQNARNMDDQIKQSDSLWGKFGGTIKTVMGFFGVQALLSWGKTLYQSAEEAGQEMNKVKQTVENAGFAWEDVGDKIDAYAQKMVELGFDDEETSMSVAHLLEITGNLNQAMAVNQVALDLARRKGMSLTQATDVLSRAMTGSARILRDFGIVVDDNASASDILNTVWSKVKGTAQASINPTEVFNVKMQNLQETLGEKLIPAITDFFDAINNFVQGGGGDLLASILDRVGQAASGLSNVMNGNMNGKWDKASFGWDYNKKIGEYDTKIKMKEDAIKQSENQEKYLSWVPWLGGKKGIQNNRAQLYQELADLNNDKLKYIDDAQNQYEQQFGGQSKSSGFTCAVCGKKFKTKAELEAHRKSELSNIKVNGAAGGNGQDKRSPYEKASAQFEIYAQENRSLEDQLAYWNKLENTVTMTAKEKDDYYKKQKELQNQLTDATKKAADELAMASAKGREKDLLDLKQRQEEDLKEVGKGSEREKDIKERYRIEQSKINAKWDHEEQAQAYDLEASLATIKNDYRAQEIATENAQFERQLEDAELSVNRSKKSRKIIKKQLVISTKSGTLKLKPNNLNCMPHR